MTYFRIVLDTPYAGTRDEYYEKFNSLKEAEEWAEETMQQHAESYEYLVTGWEDDNFDDEEEKEFALESYYQDCYFLVQEISYEEYCEETGDYE